MGRVGITTTRLSLTVKSWNVDPTYDCLECMGAVNDLHPANLFSFPIPEDMTYEDEPIKFEICLK